jgi:hypothetical protein
MALSACERASRASLVASRPVRTGGALVRLHREGEGLRHLAGFPFRRDFEWFNCPRLIEMEHGIKLVR